MNIFEMKLARFCAWQRWILCAYSAFALDACAKHTTRTPEPDASVLPDDVAGNACKRDADCAVGRCATALHITSATENNAAPGGYCTLACKIDSQCGTGAECSVPAGEETGECLSGCDDDGQCRDGYRCVGGGRVANLRLSGTCQPKPATGQLADGAVGRACTTDAECKGGECARTSPLGPELPGNYCTGRCFDDAQCGAGGGCLVFAGSGDAGHCFARCDSDADCTRDGYRCHEIGSGFNACYPAPEPLPDGLAGSPCGADPDCDGGRGICFSELPIRDLGDANEYAAAPGGYCSQSCSLDAECGASAQCISHGFDGGMCLSRCNTDDDCRAGYRCVVHGRDHTLDSVCLPKE